MSLKNTLSYSKEAKERLRFLPPEVKKGIKVILESLITNPHSGKPLQRELLGYWSIPFKRYRIIYKLPENKREIRIYTIGPRKNIYTEFSRSLVETH